MSTAAVLSDFFTAALREARSERPASLASRIPALDELTEGGFPVNALTELFIPHAGIGEVRMLLPALASLKHVTWVLPCDSEAAPYAPALADAGLDLDRQLFSIPSTPEEAFWCAEQAAASGETSAVVVWLNLSLEPEISDLIRDTPNASVPTGLAARLQARLGPGRVFRLSNLDEGLPSTSSRLAPVADAFARKPMSAPAGKADVRPTMLLSDPLPLHASDDGLAWRQESLRLVDGPVRHADDSEIRDYFVAESSSGRRVWLYRTEDSDKTEVRWHLHGFFS